MLIMIPRRVKRQARETQIYNRDNATHVSRQTINNSFDRNTV